MPRLIAIPVVLVAAGLGACAPRIESAQFRPAPAPTRAEDVRVYSAATPDCEWDEIGLVTGPATDLFTSLQSIIDRMRERAARMGGDALIHLRTAGERAGSGLPADGGSGKGGFIATVIRFTAPCAAR